MPEQQPKKIVLAYSGGLDTSVILPWLKDRYPADQGEWINEGWSAIVSPAGEIIAGPLKGEEGILTAEIDLAEVRKSRWMMDVTGHYARPDVFQLRVNEQPMTPVVRDPIQKRGPGE